jgi:hypothetical protein
MPAVTHQPTDEPGSPPTPTATPYTTHTPSPSPTADPAGAASDDNEDADDSSTSIEEYLRRFFEALFQPETLAEVIASLIIGALLAWLWGKRSNFRRIVRSNRARLNINFASEDVLRERLPLRAELVRRIIDCRSLAPFETIADIKKVLGIGDKTFNAIKDLIEV